ncbi:cytochrome ubiquinol oxidase subunit I [Micromonospora sp. NPDC050397]|uniref:cytochrome ubiquinol oxidase subunit I n=1 Tax=Micromonospora sp. NPDC050397 TaxID=3364279 RepID=UPI00384F3F23
MDALLIARLQFASTTSIHFLFVLVTLGLVTMLVYLQTAWAITGKAEYERLTRFWGTLYLINYVLGIVTGIVLEFQFGLNWSGLSRYVGNVFGAPLAIETLAAFFLESTFLGLWIFGWHRLRRGAHLALIWGVAITAYAVGGVQPTKFGGDAERSDIVAEWVARFGPGDYTPPVWSNAALGFMILIGFALLLGALAVADWTLLARRAHRGAHDLALGRPPQPSGDDADAEPTHVLAG